MAEEVEGIPIRKIADGPEEHGPNFSTKKLRSVRWRQTVNKNQDAGKEEAKRQKKRGYDKGRREDIRDGVWWRGDD